MEETNSSRRVLFLVGYMSAVSSIVCGALSACCTQALQGAVPDFQLSVARAAAQVIVYTIGGKLTGFDLTITDMTLPGLLYLGAAYMIMNVGLYGASAYIPLVEMFGMLMLGTIVTAFSHSKLVFNKDVQKTAVVSALICMFGIILATQPEGLFKKQVNGIKNSTMVPCEEELSGYFHLLNISSNCSNEVKNNGSIKGYVLAFIGGIGFGLTFDIGRIILKDVKVIAKAVYAALFCTIISAVLMFYMEEPVLIINTTQWIFVVGHAVLSGASVFLTIQGAHYVPGPLLSALYCLEVILVLVFQYTFMHSIQPGNCNWVEVLGCLIIAFGVGISSISEILAYRARANVLD